VRLEKDDSSIKKKKKKEEKTKLMEKVMLLYFFFWTCLISIYYCTLYLKDATEISLQRNVEMEKEKKEKKKKRKAVEKKNCQSWKNCKKSPFAHTFSNKVSLIDIIIKKKRTRLMIICYCCDLKIYTLWQLEWPGRSYHKPPSETEKRSQ
jgi:hypothetical protein